MKNYSEIEKEEQSKVNKLLNDCSIFFAFSNEQFEKNKTPLQPEEKYVSLGAGGYVPKSKVNDYLNGMKNIKKWKKQSIAAMKNGKEEHILYELKNHECFYLGDIQDVLWLPYSKEEIQIVFNKYYNLEMN